MVLDEAGFLPTPVSAVVMRMFKRPVITGPISRLLFSGHRFHNPEFKDWWKITPPLPSLLGRNEKQTMEEFNEMYELRLKQIEWPH